MQISTKSRYGLRALVYLANKGRCSSVKEISEKEEIPFDYLEKIFSTLKKAKLVKVKRGARGGYILALLPKKITVLKVIKVFEGTVAPVRCVAKETERKITCKRRKKCTTQKVWCSVQDSLTKTLNSVTLYDLKNK